MIGTGQGDGDGPRRLGAQVDLVSPRLSGKEFEKRRRDDHPALVVVLDGYRDDLLADDRLKVFDGIDGFPQAHPERLPILSELVVGEVEPYRLSDAEENLAVLLPRYPVRSANPYGGGGAGHPRESVVGRQVGSTVLRRNPELHRWTGLKTQGKKTHEVHLDLAAALRCRNPLGPVPCFQADADPGVVIEDRDRDPAFPRAARAAIVHILESPPRRRAQQEIKVFVAFWFAVPQNPDLDRDRSLPLLARLDESETFGQDLHISCDHGKVTRERGRLASGVDRKENGSRKVARRVGGGGDGGDLEFDPEARVGGTLDDRIQSHGGDDVVSVGSIPVQSSEGDFRKTGIEIRFARRYGDWDIEDATSQMRRRQRYRHLRLTGRNPDAG